MPANMAPVCQKTSEAPADRYSQCWECSERCTTDSVRRQRIPNSRSRAAESSTGKV